MLLLRGGKYSYLFLSHKSIDHVALSKLFLEINKGSEVSERKQGNAIQTRNSYFTSCMF